MTPEDIAAQIRLLDPYERRQLDSLLASEKDEAKQLPREAQYLVEAIFEISRVRPPLAQLRKMQIINHTNELFDWLGDQITGLREVQIAGLVLVCLKAIAYDLRRRKLSVDPAALLAEIPRIGLAMDRAYPGYWEARMLHRLVPQADRDAA